MKIRSEELEFMKFVEDTTKARVKDCIMSEDEIIIVVNKGSMGQAIGKKGENINKVRKNTVKTVSVVEFSDDLATFLSGLFTQNKVENWSQKGDTVYIQLAKRVGMQSKKMQHAKELLSRYYSIKNVKLE